MFRKLTLALAATAALGTASLAISSTPAEAKKGGHHHHHHHGHHHHGHWHKGHWHKHHHHFHPVFTGVYGSCYVKRWVPTPFGYYKLRWVNICL